jgi:hypothetical protein
MGVMHIRMGLEVRILRELGGLDLADDYRCLK